MTKHLISRRSFLHGSALFLGACGSSLQNFPFDRSTDPIPEQPGLGITYYSVGCFLIEFGNEAVLTDPFWSHRSLWEVGFKNLGHDVKEINKHRASLKNVSSVLVGHSHYDHCLDLDQITDDLQPGAKIYGGKTLQHIFAHSELTRPIIPVNDSLADPDESGQWFYNETRTVRVLPIRSGHPNQWLCFHLYADKLHEDAHEKPDSVGDYQEGITIAFLIDFMDGNEIEQRVYVQTSSTGYPAGFFPQSILEEHPVDAALLAMDCANIKAEGELPSVIDFLNPKRVVFCHWEDFFEPKEGTPQEIIKVDLPKLKAFFKSTDDRRYIFPYWNSRFVFPR